MKIAQLSPLWESVPPQLYGGTERIVSYVTEELVRQGHEVTLFASGDSTTGAKLKAACPRALRLHETGYNNRDAPLVLMQEQALGAASGEYDIIHSHLDFLSFPLSRRAHAPVVTTLHGRLDLPELQPICPLFPFQTPSANLCPRPIGRGPSTTAFPKRCTQRITVRGRIWRFWGAYRPRSAPITRLRWQSGSACPCESLQRSIRQTTPTLNKRSNACSTIL